MTTESSPPLKDPRGKPLRVVLRWHVLGTALVPLLVVEVSLLLLYLAFGQEVAGRWREEVTQTLRSNLQAVVDARAQQLSLTLEGIGRQTEMVRTQAGLLLREEVLPAVEYRPELYAKGEGGALYQPKDDGGASIYYSASTPIGPKQQRKLAVTDPLDPLLRNAVQSDPHIVAAYLNTHDDLSRYYPFIPNTTEQFPPSIQMEDFAFYYAADAEHDPERRVVWTDAYLDPAGNGWMVSSVAPVYSGDHLEGVVGLDVTIPVIAERVLALDLPYEAPALLLTEDGTLLGLSREATKYFAEGTAILDRAPTKIDDRGERTLEQETPLASLLGDAGAAETLQEYIQTSESLAELRVGDESFFVVHASVGDPRWSLVLLVDEREVMAPVEAIESRSRTMALVVIGGMALFYALFFRVIYRRSQDLADRLATPLGKLEEATKTKEPPPTASESGILEIDVLGLGFREMMETNLEHQAHIETLNRNLEVEIDQEVRKSRVKDHQLVEQSRLASLGEMVASIAHQWRQPLTSLQFLVDDLRMQLEEDDPIDPVPMVDDLDDAQELIGHMNQTIDDFRALYRSTDETETVALSKVVSRAMSVADGGLKSAGIHVSIEDASEDAVIEGRPNELCHALLNLLSNAHNALIERKIEGPTIVIRLAVEGERCIIEVEDNAGGIDPEVADRLFDAFATTRSNGTGLGLHMSRRLVVERFGGTLEVHEGAEGARFRIDVPPVGTDVSS